MAHRRVLETYPLLLSSTREQIEAVRSKMADYLRDSTDFCHLDSAPQFVNVAGFGQSSVDIFFCAWTNSGSYPEYLDVRERLALKVKEVAENAGTALAYPTQSVIIENPQQAKPD